MRGLLVVNPKATTTSPRVTDVIVHALSDQIDLTVTVTTHKGHGLALGQLALDQGMDIVLTLGGDGVVNEVVNGLLSDGPGRQVPLLATIPGGSGNVFARSLGLPADAAEATGQILDRLRENTSRSIGLGRAGDRWFVANAGLGIDAEIIAAMERHRQAGHAASPTRYLATAITEFFRGTDRRDPALTLTRPGGTRVEGVFLAAVQNTSPWTYYGSWPVNPCPEASFDTGLDVFAMRRMRVPTALRATRRMLWSASARPAASGTSPHDALLVWHDQSGFTLTAHRPVEMQIDGEGMGKTTEVVFTSHPHALRVVC